MIASKSQRDTRGCCLIFHCLLAAEDQVTLPGGAHLSFGGLCAQVALFARRWAAPALCHLLSPVILCGAVMDVAVLGCYFWDCVTKGILSEIRMNKGKR